MNSVRRNRCVNIVKGSRRNRFVDFINSVRRNRYVDIINGSRRNRCKIGGIDMRPTIGWGTYAIECVINIKKILRCF